MDQTDSSCAERHISSPNFGPRRGPCQQHGRPDMIILHYTGMDSADRALDWLCDQRSEVSCHYLIYEDGRCVQLVRECDRAWHAGQSCWRGDRDINSRSIGIEIANGGPASANPQFTREQITTTIALCRDLIMRYDIPARHVLGHSDVAPGRKTDPGPCFPWEELAQAGIGLWYDPVPFPPPQDTGQPGSMTVCMATVQKKLAMLGYCLAPTGLHDAHTQAVLTAFRAHWPGPHNDSCDTTTQMILDALLKRLG